MYWAIDAEVAGSILHASETMGTIIVVMRNPYQYG